MKISFRALSCVALLGAISIVALAQQPPAQRKRVPRLTTEDVAGEKAASTTVEVSAEEAKAGQPKTKSAAAEEKISPEEATWRENIKQARARAKQTERDAEEGELRVTEIRNQLNATNQTTAQRNQAAAD